MDHPKYVGSSLSRELKAKRILEGVGKKVHAMNTSTKPFNTFVLKK
jgi:hypothetical protein